MITLEIKKLHLFEDQIESMGEVTLEECIIAFHNFPWEDQIEELTQREWASTVPSMILTDENLNRLSIYANNLKSFQIIYENDRGSAHLILSNDILLNPNGNGPEDYIDMFFNQNIEEVIEVDYDISGENAEESEIEIPDEILQYSFNDRRKWQYLRWPIIVLLANLTFLMLFYVNPPQESELLFLLFLQMIAILIWGGDLFLFVTYSIQNFNAVLMIGNETKKVMYSDRYGQLIFGRDQIADCLIIYSGKEFQNEKSFNYLRIKLKSGKTITITCLLADLGEVQNALKINCNWRHSYFPSL
jgi:hypothetical protein